MLLGDVELVSTALQVKEVAAVAVNHMHVYYLRTADADKAVGRKHLLHLLELETDCDGTCLAKMYVAVVVVRLNPFYIAVAYLYLVVIVNRFHKKSVVHHRVLLSFFFRFIHRFVFFGQIYDLEVMADAGLCETLLRVCEMLRHESVAAFHTLCFCIRGNRLYFECILKFVGLWTGLRII